MTNETKHMLHITWMGLGLVMSVGFGVYWLLTSGPWWAVALNAVLGIYSGVRVWQLHGPKQTDLKDKE